MNDFVAILIIVAMISFVWYRHNKYKNGQLTEKQLKHRGLKTTLWTILIMLIGSGINGAFFSDTSNSDQSEEPSKVEQKSNAKKATPKKKSLNQSSSSSTKLTKKKSVKKTTPKETNKKPKVTEANKQAAALLMLKENFKGTAKVWFDAENKAFMIQPTGTEFKEELLEVIATQNTSDWETLTYSMDKLSKSLYKNLGLADFVSVVNPDNPDKVLYSSLNGHSAYDFLKDAE